MIFYSKKKCMESLKLKKYIDWSTTFNLIRSRISTTTISFSLFEVVV